MMKKLMTGQKYEYGTTDGVGGGSKMRWLEGRNVQISHS